MSKIWKRFNDKTRNKTIEEAIDALGGEDLIYGNHYIKQKYGKNINDIETDKKEEK